jgi:branched-chain amino acid transport system substrate-binding protein
MLQRRLLTALIVPVLVLGACGTRADERAVATPTQATPGPASAPGDVSSAQGAQRGPEAASTAPNGAGSASSAPLTPTSSRAGGGTSGSSASPVSGTKSTGAGAPGTVVNGPAKKGSPSDAPAGISDGPKPATPATPSNATRSPVKLGSVGTLSGPLGKPALAILSGVQIWQQHINSAGGVNGHPVTLVVADDGGDPARHRALHQKLVEQDHVLAFVQNFEVISRNKATIDYLNAKRIPVIGGEGSGDHYYQSPMYFPQAAAGDTILYTSIAGAAQYTVAKGKTKYGMLVCQEAQLCKDGERVWTEAAPKLGVQIVYTGRGSLAQPDFTAQCLAARNAGVEVLLLILDPNSILRMLASCSRQGYSPILGLTGSEVEDQMRNDPNMDGALAMSSVFPYFQVGTPATDQFQAAMAKFAPQQARGVGPATGWTTGKLFEKVAAAMAEPPTTEAILRGLWSLRDDTLGGLTQPLTFREGQNSPRDPACWFAMQVSNKKWVSPDGFQPHCAQQGTQR